MMKILIVDDDPLSREALVDFVSENLGHDVQATGEPSEALASIAGTDFDLVISDIRMPGTHGIGLIEQMRQARPDGNMRFVLVTAYADVNSSIQALRLGVADYLQKPVNVDELARAINRVRNERAAQVSTRQVGTTGPGGPVATHRHTTGSDAADSSILVYRSDSMERVRREAESLAAQPTVPVLIEGETGTGKEVISRLLHAGPGPFVALNCAAIPTTLFESELFGYEDGAFTGARKGGAPGRFESAGEGTVFLDEINELPLSAQPKLLRALQERAFRRVGGDRVIQLKARVVCASNQSLEALVAGGSFRADLFYRIAVGRIRLPALRERPEDIPLLAEHFLRQAASQLGKRFTHLSEDGRSTLLRYHWPGNVRELRNVIERAVLTADDELLRAAHLEHLKKLSAPPQADSLRPGKIELPDEPFDLVALEREIVQKALDRFGGNKSRAAEYLGLSRSALRSRLPD